MALPPFKQERKICYEARDNFWKCLEQNIEETKCKTLKILYEKSCPKQWVDHFNRQRKLEIYKKNFDYTKIQQDKVEE
ncbi:unnamed protein product [Gordionus sp. m RMFG-2023]